jgi:predicted DNA-binding antitoxin AbrB/MazE fold protein
MRLEAIYEKGHLKFLRPVRFVRDRIKVFVEIPEHELASTQPLNQDQEKSDYVQDLVLRLDQIRKAPLPLRIQDKQTTQKQQERFEAFSLREDH